MTAKDRYLNRAEELAGNAHYYLKNAAEKGSALIESLRALSEETHTAARDRVLDVGWEDEEAASLYQKWDGQQKFLSQAEYVHSILDNAQRNLGIALEFIRRQNEKQIESETVTLRRIPGGEV